MSNLSPQLGASAAAMLIFILPSAFYIKLVKKESMKSVQKIGVRRQFNIDMNMLENRQNSWGITRKPRIFRPSAKCVNPSFPSRPPSSWYAASWSWSAAWASSSWTGSTTPRPAQTPTPTDTKAPPLLLRPPPRSEEGRGGSRRRTATAAQPTKIEKKNHCKRRKNTKNSLDARLWLSWATKNHAILRECIRTLYSMLLETTQMVFYLFCFFSLFIVTFFSSFSLVICCFLFWFSAVVFVVRVQLKNKYLKVPQNRKRRSRRVQQNAAYTQVRCYVCVAVTSELGKQAKNPAARKRANPPTIDSRQTDLNV